MSLTDSADDLTLTPERPSQRSLDPTQPTAEEQAARAQAQEQLLRARAPRGPAPPQQGPGVAFPRLSPTNPAQVASLQPQIPQTPMPGVPTEQPGQEKQLASLDPNKAAEPAEAPAEQPAAIPNYDLNAPATYRPPSPNREPGQWGDDWFPTKAAEAYPGVAPGPDMPSPQEAYPNAADANRRLAHLSDGPIAEAHMRANLLMNPLAAVADAFSQGRFSQNFSASYLRGLQIQQEEALTELYLANQGQKKFLSGLGGIIEMSRGPNPLLNEQQAKDAIRNYLIENHHQSWVPFLDSHNIAGIARLAQIQDAQLRRSEASGVTIRKAMDVDGQDAVLRGWGINTGGLGGTGGLPGDQPARAGAEEGGPPLRGELAPFNQLSADQKQAAYDLFNHREPSKDLNLLINAGGARGKEAVGQIFQFARALDARANRIAAYQDPKMDPEELSQKKLDAIKQMNAEYGSTIEGLKNLTIDPKSEQAKNRLHAVTQTQQIFPRWNQDSYNQFHTVWNNAQSRESQQLQAANRATTSVIPFEKAVNGLPISETAAWPARVWAEIKTKGFTSDPAYAALNEPLRTLATEVVFASGGRSQVTAVQQFLREAPLTGSKASLRTLARQSMIGVKGIVDQQTNTFHKTTGLSGRPPAFDERSDQIMDALVRSNPYTGVFPKDAPVELRAIEPKAAQRNQRLTPDKSWEPLTREDYDKRKRYIEKNPNDPLIQLYMDELGIMQ
jgi:hypothetical protein